MAATNVPDEPSLLPIKRKPDLSEGDHEDHHHHHPSNKNPKLEQPLLDSEELQDKAHNQSLESLANDKLEPEDDDSEEEEAEYEEDEDDAEVNGTTQVDRKGKGITRDDKGKGKMIYDDEIEEDSDDSSDEGSDYETEDSDLSDDPLAEVDLDNILPSRTRRRSVQPGVYISKTAPPEKEGDSDDDDSDA